MSALHTGVRWRAIKWTCHAPTTVVTDDSGPQVVIAEFSGQGRSSADCVKDARATALLPQAFAILETIETLLTRGAPASMILDENSPTLDAIRDLLLQARGFTA